MMEEEVPLVLVRIILPDSTRPESEGQREGSWVSAKGVMIRSSIIGSIR